MNRSTLRWTVVAVLAAFALLTEQLAHPQQRAVITEILASPVPEGFVFAAEVVDGDTIRLADGSVVRYIGVDTPETVHPKKAVQCYGKEASSFNRSLVEGMPVKLVRDISDTDKYDRLLRYVYLEDGTFVNLALIAQGYAQAVTYPPDIAHAAEFRDAQAAARAAGLGLWGSCR
jgi:endonuclease YncB( thermonuclease family)